MLNPKGGLKRNNRPKLVNGHLSHFICVPSSVGGNPFADQPVEVTSCNKELQGTVVRDLPGKQSHVKQSPVQSPCFP